MRKMSLALFTCFLITVVCTGAVSACVDPVCLSSCQADYRACRDGCSTYDESCILGCMDEKNRCVAEECHVTALVCLALTAPVK